jgi:hypothetical protein
LLPCRRCRCRCRRPFRPSQGSGRALPTAFPPLPQHQYHGSNVNTTGLTAGLRAAHGAKPRQREIWIRRENRRNADGFGARLPPALGRRRAPQQAPRRPVRSPGPAGPSAPSSHCGRLQQAVRSMPHRRRQHGCFIGGSARRAGVWVGPQPVSGRTLCDT